MSYKLKIDYVGDDSLVAIFTEEAKRYSITVTDTGQRPNGNYELLVESQSLTDMYDFLLANYFADNDKEEALWHLTQLEK